MASPELRTSTYTFAVPLGDGHSLLLNQLAGSADHLPSELADQVMRAPECTEGELRDYLIGRGYTTYETGEQQRSRLRALADSIELDRAEAFRAPLFSFVVTYGCNLSCPYCYESKVRTRSQSDDMTLEMARMCMDVVRDAPKHPDRAVVELFGGEPLMRRTRPVVEEIVHACAEMGLKVRATTNGTGIDHFIDLLGPGLIADLQVSLDGPPELHDIRRVGRGKVPTFDKIVGNIFTALDHGCQVTIRANVDDENLHGLIPLVELLDGKGLLDNPLCRFEYIDVKTEPRCGGTCGIVGLGDIEEHVTEKMSDHPSVMKLFDGDNPLRAWLDRYFYAPTTRYCGAVTNNVYFSPDGLIYGCHEVVGRPEMAIGCVEDRELVMAPFADSWRSRSLGNLPDCMVCPFALMCAGGCAAHLDLESKPFASQCDGMKRVFPSVLRRLYQASQHVPTRPNGRR